MTQWRVRLNGNSLSRLSELMNSPSASILVEGTEYYLISELFATSLEIGDLNRIADDLVNKIGDAAFVQTGVLHGLTVHSIVKVHDDGTRTHSMTVNMNVTVNVEMGATRIAVNGDLVDYKLSQTLSIGRALDAALRDPKIAETFALFSRKRDDWTQLCNVICLVRDAIGGDVPAAWVSTAKIEALERTAQTRETAGDTARHANARYDPPKNPMPLNEAQRIVQQILQQWVQSSSAGSAS